MENITYSERAKWYSIETRSDEQNCFLERIISTYRAPIVMQIPCSSGKNLATIARSSKKVIGLDTDREMRLVAKEEVKREKIENCSVRFGDLKCFKIEKSISLVLVLNEAIQMFNPDNGELLQVINNILSQLDGDLLVEAFDYRNSGNNELLRYYSFSQSGKIVKDFEYIDSRYILKRYHKAVVKKEKIELTYYYKKCECNSPNQKWFRAYLVLYHFDFSKFESIVKQCGGYIKSLYSDYDMSQQADSSKKIMVISKEKRCDG